MAKASCNVTIGKTSNPIKTIAYVEFTISQHNFDCACSPVGQQIKHSFDWLTVITVDNKEREQSAF